MHVATANGILLHYAVQGPAGAPALVLSNSLGTDFRVWDRFAALIGERFRLVRYDKRGHGLSAAPAGPYAIEDHVADLAGLLDHIGVTEAMVCGLSVGGMIAQGLAAMRPALVKGLVLCDTAHKIGPPEMWESRMSAIRQGGIAALAQPILERWFSERFHREQPEEVAGWRNMLVRTPLEGYLGTCAAIRDADLTEQAGAIGVPVLCVCGSEDGATPPDLVRALAALIPAARFEEIEGVGHLPCVEKADVLAQLMVHFIEETGLV